MFLKIFKITKIILFAAMFSVFGFGILSAPKAEAVLWGGTFSGGNIVASRDNVSMCTTNGGTFTVKNGAIIGSGTPIVGATVSFKVLQEKIGATTTPLAPYDDLGSCASVTNSSGECAVSFSKIVKGDITVTVNNNIVTPVISAVKGATTETGFCTDNCDNDLEVGKGKDCADPVDCPENAFCGVDTNTGLNKSCKSTVCTTPSGTLTLSANPTSVVAGGTAKINITFTSNFDGVRIVLSGPPGFVINTSSSTNECTTDSSKRCSIEVNPPSEGAITATATKTGYVSPASPTVIQVTSANTITVTTNPTSVVAGTLRNVTFTTNVSGVSVTLSDKASGGCVTDINFPFDCQIPITAASAGTINVIAAKTGTTPPLTPGTTTIRVNPAAGQVGGGIYGLTNKPLKDIINGITEWLLGLAAGLTILYLVWGGIYYVTASGDENQIEEGKRIIKYALLGLFVIGISYSIVVALDKLIK